MTQYVCPSYVATTGGWGFAFLRYCIIKHTCRAMFFVAILYPSRQCRQGNKKGRQDSESSGLFQVDFIVPETGREAISKTFSKAGDQAELGNA